MSLQFLSDSTGKTTRVFIPINEWNELKEKIGNIDLEESGIPAWHKEILNSRLNEYENNPDAVMDFDIAMDDIDKGI